MGTVSYKASPVFTLKIMYRSGKIGKKQTKNKTKQTKQPKQNKTKQKKNPGRPDLIYDMSDDRWMRSRRIGKGGNLHLQ